MASSFSFGISGDPDVLTLWQVIVLPLYNPAFPLGLHDVQMINMKSVLLLHPLLDLLIVHLAFRRRHIHLIHIALHTDMILRLRKFGQKTYRLHMPRDTIMNVHSTSELTNQSASNRRNLLFFVG